LRLGRWTRTDLARSFHLCFYHTRAAHHAACVCAAAVVYTVMPTCYLLAAFWPFARKPFQRRVLCEAVPTALPVTFTVWLPFGMGLDAFRRRLNVGALCPDAILDDGSLTLLCHPWACTPPHRALWCMAFRTCLPLYYRTGFGEGRLVITGGSGMRARARTHNMRTFLRSSRRLLTRPRHLRLSLLVLSAFSRLPPLQDAGCGAHFFYIFY